LLIYINFIRTLPVNLTSRSLILYVTHIKYSRIEILVVVIKAYAMTDIIYHP